MHPELVMAIAAATCMATLGGGAAALRLRDRLHLILGFSAGAVIAVSFFDLLPESLKLAGLAPEDLVTLMAVGFFAYLVLDRLILFHTHLDAHGPTVSVERGWMAATSLSAHSFMDGFAIGIGFQASMAVGAVVAAAASLFVRLSAASLSMVLAVFAGFFFYIGASDLLPDSYHAHPKVLTTV